MNFKQKIYEQYLQLVNDKIISLQAILDELSDSAKNESKSTAGDKHETALAMLQIEQENTRAKYKEAAEQKNQLERIDIHSSSAKIIKGSLIKTDKGYLFLSIALGKIIIDGVAVTSLSTLSPLGAKLLGFQVSDVVEINRMKYLIEEIS